MVVWLGIGAALLLGALFGWISDRATDRLSLAVALVLIANFHPTLVPVSYAPVAEVIEFPDIPPPPPPRPAVQEVEWQYKVKDAGGMTNVTMAIAQIAQDCYSGSADCWGRPNPEFNTSPVVTGTTHWEGYDNDLDHVEGCAIDFRIWGFTLLEAVELSQAIAANVHAKVDDQARVVLWYDHRPWDPKNKKADHIHVEIQDCGRPMARSEIWALWSWNHLELRAWQIDRSLPRRGLWGI